MMNKSRKHGNFALVIMTGVILIGGCAINVKNTFLNVLPGILSADLVAKETYSNVETVYQDNFVGKSRLVDINGIAQKLLGRKIIGNMEYVVDSDGVIHAVTQNTYSIPQFTSQVLRIKELADAKNTPFLYVQGPNREISGEQSEMQMFNTDDIIMDELIAEFESNNVDVLDERELLLSNPPETFTLSDTFFHTDLHLSSEAEAWAANEIGKYLKDEYQIPLNNMEYLSNISENFDTIEYPFVGNYARYVGQYYTEPDMFQMYIPKFETNYTVYTGGQTVVGEGSFQETLMNGYEINLAERPQFTYWVTNYLRYTDPYYTIKNNMQDSGKILVVTDSIGYRTIAHLSLTASEITVLDPRFFNGTDYIHMVLTEQEFDAVVFYQGTFLMGFGF